jgi:hypothetical protein
MSRHRDEHLDLCAARVLGVLDDSGPQRAGRAPGRRAARSARRSCADLAGGALVLAMSAPQHRAPAGVRARVLAAIDAGARAAASWNGRRVASVGGRGSRARPARWLAAARCSRSRSPA